MVSERTNLQATFTRETNGTVTVMRPSFACQHHFCGNSWVTRSSTTGGDPGGTTAWGVCCKCGALSEPAYRSSS